MRGFVYVFSGDNQVRIETYSILINKNSINLLTELGRIIICISQADFKRNRCCLTSTIIINGLENKN